MNFPLILVVGGGSAGECGEGSWGGGGGGWRRGPRFDRACGKGWAIRYVLGKISSSMAFSFGAFHHLKGNCSSDVTICITCALHMLLYQVCGRQEARDAKIRKELGQNKKMIFTENEK
jgi:hypothetical protein